MRITPASELIARYRKLQSLMEKEGLDAILMVQSADLFYFTGSIQQGALYVPAGGEPVYMVRREYSRARMECGLKEVVPFRSPKDIPGILADFGYPLPKRVGMEFDVLPVGLFQRFQKVLEGCALVDAAPLIRTVRAVKSGYEIEIMKDAALQVDKVCQTGEGGDPGRHDRLGAGRRAGVLPPARPATRASPACAASTPSSSTVMSSPAPTAPPRPSTTPPWGGWG